MPAPATPENGVTSSASSDAASRRAGAGPRSGRGAENRAEAGAATIRAPKTSMAIVSASRLMDPPDGRRESRCAAPVLRLEDLIILDRVAARADGRALVRLGHARRPLHHLRRRHDVPRDGDRRRARARAARARGRVPGRADVLRADARQQRLPGRRAAPGAAVRRRDEPGRRRGRGRLAVVLVRGLGPRAAAGRGARGRGGAARARRRGARRQVLRTLRVPRPPPRRGGRRRVVPAARHPSPDLPLATGDAHRRRAAAAARATCAGSSCSSCRRPRSAAASAAPSRSRTPTSRWPCWPTSARTSWPRAPRS